MIHHEGRGGYSAGTTLDDTVGLPTKVSDPDNHWAFLPSQIPFSHEPIFVIMGRAPLDRLADCSFETATQLL